MVTDSVMTFALGVIARSAPPQAVRDAAIGPLCPSRGSVFERSRLAFSEREGQL